MNFAA